MMLYCNMFFLHVVMFFANACAQKSLCLRIAFSIIALLWHDNSAYFRSSPTSHEVDTWPISGNSKAADLLEAIGEMSPFHEQFGIYVDPYSPSNAILPKGWEARTHPFQSDDTKGAVGYCLEKHDLVVSKMARGETKDLNFISELLKRNLIDKSEVESRIHLINPDQQHYQLTGESPNADIRVRVLANWREAIRIATEPALSGKQNKATKKAAHGAVSEFLL